MADQTYAGQLIGDIYAGGDPSTQRAGTVATGETVKPGYAIRVVSGQVYASKAADVHCSGFASLKDGNDIDTAYTVGELIEYYPLGQKTVIWVRLQSASPIAAVKIGEHATQGSEDGKVSKWAYTDGAQATDSNIIQVGRFASADAGHLTDDHMVKLSLSA